MDQLIMRAHRTRAIPTTTIVAIALLGLGLAAACGPSDNGPGSAGSSASTPSLPIVPAPSVATPSARPTIALEQLVANSSEVMFKAVDGAELSGRLFGDGDVGLVLSHMGELANNQTDWFWFAGQLADRGYRVLTYNRRGVCPGGLGGCSVGNDAYRDDWKDILGAVETLRGAGVSRVVVIGASLGAMNGLRAAEEPDSGMDGFVWIAGSLSDFDQAQVAKISVPVLVVAASGDPIGLFVDARILDRWLTTSRGLVLPESHLHGTDMLQPQADPIVSERLLDEIVSFIRSIG